MRSQPRDFAKLTLVALALVLSQCAGKTKSQQVLITVNPSSPIVFTSNLIYQNSSGSTQTINSPWFRFSVAINNTSDTAVTIIGLHIEVTGMSSSGAATTKMADLSPESDNFTTTGTPAVTCDFLDYGQFDPKGFSTGCVSGGIPTYDPTTGVSLCPDKKTPPSFNNLSLYEVPTLGSVGCTVVAALPNFILGDNPPPASPESIVYTVKVVPVGWFGTRSSPTDRFDNFVYIYTQ